MHAMQTGTGANGVQTGTVLSCMPMHVNGEGSLDANSIHPLFVTRSAA
ncbi:hypothetical protein SBF1_3400002 [Candidatus Desulfosporosinus infrequens]|uniref:Uncharacterized protein n=1 Tax=Candidatus Desulfosporosinus infrequens TaxID=2043169 RepID=A0A2U3L293_9FIRM|nr:hypothetical protein SBF1_3400002 [Candidatus Desulfosporosinus infrequens]